jgi:hypothetical protein
VRALHANEVPTFAEGDKKIDEHFHAVGKDLRSQTPEEAEGSFDVVRWRVRDRRGYGGTEGIGRTQASSQSPACSGPWQCQQKRRPSESRRTDSDASRCRTSLLKAQWAEGPRWDCFLSRKRRIRQFRAIRTSRRRRVSTKNVMALAYLYLALELGRFNTAVRRGLQQSVSSVSRCRNNSLTRPLRRVQELGLLPHNVIGNATPQTDLSKKSPMGNSQLLPPKPTARLEVPQT